MRIVKDPEERKKEILDGALRVFATKGYDKTTITDIAKELGISQGLCYRYYASKEDIYDTALETYAEYIVANNLKRFKSCGDSLKEKIEAFSGNLEEYRTPEKENGLLYDLFHGEHSRKMHDQLMLKISEKLVPHITIELKKAQESGEIRVPDIETAAYFLVFGQLGILMNSKHEADSGLKIKECLIDFFKL